MIILSVGMPRAGSGWYYNLTNDLMLATGAQDARWIRSRYHLQNILTEVNCNIGALTPRRLLSVTIPSLLGNTFVIKAHSAPTPIALLMIRKGMILPTYIYRDPRDAMLSAMENGERARQRGSPNAFSTLTDFETALKFTLAHIHIWESWLQCWQALHTRYESFLCDYEKEVDRLMVFLELDRENPDMETIIEKYRSKNAQTVQKGLHFSKGKIGRFRQKMTPEQQEILAQKLGPFLERMGYEV
jgi:hypothetical protein